MAKLQYPNIGKIHAMHSQYGVVFASHIFYSVTDELDFAGKSFF